VVPTLHADEPLKACLRSLGSQTITDFDIIVVDNSGRRLVPRDSATQVIYNDRNLGFGAAINQAIRASDTPFIATLNDDAVAQPRWLESLLAAIEQRYEIGMCASQVRLDDGRLDSAGMLICRDGSSKQRGHLEAPSAYNRAQEVLLPSASAALYRRDMLEEIGLFDEGFFLYCEDTDLGLRARWAAWECRYVPGAVVEHRYSHSAGKASGLKAYYVERNRLYVIFKNFPVDSLLMVPFYATARYFWHSVFALQGRGTAANFGREGNSMVQLPWFVLRAHAELTRHAFKVWRLRRTMKRRLTSKQFRKLLRFYSIGPKQVAAL
jgi:GT2 family glycosyltransferase